MYRGEPPKTVIFLGPSLSRETARSILEAEFRDPAKRGDIPQAVRDGARIIGLIDGVFFQDCSVGHKEILSAVQNGVKVVGASSMGALRASELDIYGMEGVGEIYAMYKSGIIESDDEVALVFDPFTFSPLSEPLINIRFNLELAVNAGALTKDEATTILDAARDLYFPERTFEHLAKCAFRLMPDDRIAAWMSFLKRSYRDLKREDAIAALIRISQIWEGGG